MCIGALVGAGMDLGLQVLGNLARGCDPFDSIDWGQVAVSGALGAVGGGLGSFAKSFRAADEVASLTSGAANTGNRVFWSGGDVAKFAASAFAKANGSKTWR